VPLYIVSTPIGNLGDLTRRAVEVLRDVEIVLAEDTRHTRKLLDAAGVSATLRCYHDHSSEGVRSELVAALTEGVPMALVSDAGTPCLSDPGFALVRDALMAGVDVTPVPGASALLAFLVAAGLEPDRFQFVGFPPRAQAARESAVTSWLAYEGTTLAYESPRRVAALVGSIAAQAPLRRVVVGRELTKLHEEFVRGSASEVADVLCGRERQRGEFVVGIARGPRVDPEMIEADPWIDALLEAGMKTRGIAKLVGGQLGLPVAAIYARVLERKG